MELEDFLEANVIIISLIVWLVVVIAIWKFTIIDSDFYTWKMKMIVSISCLPLTWLIVTLVANKN